ncbi:MAG: hypothetical protein ACJAXY_001893 [Nonlabens sp.]|jgi:hypothetical protein
MFILHLLETANYRAGAQVLYLGKTFEIQQSNAAMQINEVFHIHT